LTGLACWTLDSGNWNKENAIAANAKLDSHSSWHCLLYQRLIRTGMFSSLCQLYDKSGKVWLSAKLIHRSTRSNSCTVVKSFELAPVPEFPARNLAEFEVAEGFRCQTAVIEER